MEETIMKRQWEKNAAEDAARVFFQQVGETSITNCDVEVKRLRREVRRLTQRVAYFEHIVPHCAWPEGAGRPECADCSYPISCGWQRHDCSQHTESDNCSECGDAFCEDCLDTCTNDSAPFCLECFIEHCRECIGCRGLQ